MKPFRILIVDDEVDWAQDFKENLETERMSDLVNREFDHFEIQITTNQTDAENAVRNAGTINYDLILLDLRYPLEPAGTIDDFDEQFQGMKWLPELRRLQPHAAIVVLTSYAGERNLNLVVESIRDHQANEFIPKTAPFGEIFARMGVAWSKARHEEQIELFQEEFHSLLRTRAARCYAEDVGIILNDFKSSLDQLSKRLASNNKSVANSIKMEFDRLQTKFTELTNLLNSGQEKRREIDAAALTRQMLGLYHKMIENAQAKLTGLDENQVARVTTYQGDLKVALHEVIANAINSLEGSRTPPMERELRISVEEADDHLTIRVVDNGDGFSAEALSRRFEQGFTTKKIADDDTHQGLGLYITRRMMQSIGGDVKVENLPDGGGAMVTLIVRNFPS